MKSSDKSVKDIDIVEYYSLKIGSIWGGFKLEGAAFKWLCVYLFFEYVRPQSLYPALDILPWGQLALLATCIAAFFDPTVKIVKYKGNIILIVFMSVVLLSSLFAFRPSLSFSRFDIIISWVILYILITSIINTEKRFFVFLLVFFLVNFKMSQFGFRSFISGGYSSWGVSGSPGWFKDSGDLGIEMTIFVSLAIGFALGLKEHWGKIKKLAVYFLPLTGVITIVATSSRGAVLGFVALVFWYLLKSRLGIKSLIGGLIVGGTLYLVTPAELLEEFHAAGEDKTSVLRLQLWEFGMEIVEEYPVFGIGYNNWVDYCWYINPGGVNDSGKCSIQHNTMVQAVTEIGITGLILYLLIIIMILHTNVRTRANARRVNNKYLHYMAHGLDAGLISYIVSSFFYSTLFYPMFWVQLSLTVALNKISINMINENK